jgi:FkbM family methyltransferase
MIDWCKPLLRRCSALPTWINGSLMWRPGELWGAFRQTYEPEVARHLHSVLANCDGMIDIGAHHGIWTVWAARQFPTLKIVAVEPGRVRESLFETLRLNGIASRVQVLDACVSGRRDTVTYFDNGLMTAALSRQQAESYCPPDQRNTITERSLEAVTLDDVLDMARRFCDGDRLLVKCDIEGHETDVFADCPALEDRRLSFIVELHHVQSPDDSIVVTNARAAGREVTTLGQFWGGTVTVAF